MRKSHKGAIAAGYLIALGVVALVGLFVAKPKVLSGDSKRADAAVETTKKLEDATKKNDAMVAASVTKIGEANSEAPDSKQKEFIAREIMVALGLLPAPDNQGLIDAEKRKVAVLSGQVEQINKLYREALKNNEQLMREKDEAVAAKHESDQKIVEAAAERLGMERQRNLTLAIIAIVIIAFIYVKVTHFSPAKIGEVVADIKRGVHPITALDTVASQLQQKIVNKVSKLKS